MCEVDSAVAVVAVVLTIYSRAAAVAVGLNRSASVTWEPPDLCYSVVSVEVAGLEPGC